MNRHRTETLRAAQSVLDGYSSKTDAARKYGIHFSSVWRAVKLFSPYTKANKKRLHDLLT